MTKFYFKRSIISLLVLFISLSVFSQTFPTGFNQVKIASMTQLTAMAFAPDGRLFMCQRNGTVRVIKNGQLLATPFLTLTVDQNGERGISGITFDPNFTTNNRLYIYYTATTPAIHNRLSRFTANGDVVQVGSEVVLLDAEPVTSVFHNGGGLGFGPDGKLYLAMGEDNKPSNAQSLTTYKGKLLRMNADGSAPADNPYSSSTNPITKLIWCLGLRNPYTMTFESGTGRLFINNVGADSWEEIHDGTAPDQNFGWPAVEGFSSNSAYDNPVFAYPHESVNGQRGCAITGGAFFKPASTTYPSAYHGRYFYMDYCNGWIYTLVLGPNNTYTNSVFATGLTTKNLAMQVGPDGNLYYINRDETKGGIYKIQYTNTSAPIITNNPVSTTVTAGQPALFEVSASGANPLSYQWRKNGADIPGATTYSYMIASAQSSDAAQYSARVSNSSGTVTSNNASLTVAAYNAPPDAAILTPTPTAYFRAGDTIHFTGTATDAEDGNLPASAFQWEVEFHHNNDHFHPGQAIPAGIKTGSFITSNSDHTTANVFYRLKLKVTDSNGLIDTAHIDIFPITSSLTLNTQPAGLQVTYGSQPVETPFNTLTVEGLRIPIGDVSPQTKNGFVYAFDKWLHGGPANQTITIGEGDSTYTAIYKQTGVAVDQELIASGASWKYLDNGTNQGTAWTGISFSDASWKTGNAQLGYGDGDEATVVGYGTSSSSKFITTYFRKAFYVSDPATISALELQLKRDDGAVVYLNGSEVFRNNMPEGTVTYTTRAVTFVDGAEENTFLVNTISKSALVNGNNLLAVEIHQNSGSSSDISFDLKLKATNSSTVTPPPSGCSGTGNITREYWANVVTSSVSEVPVNSVPTSTSLLSIFDGPSNIADNYGSRIRGFICPPQTGQYVFWIASDNSSELWLSTSDNENSKVKIAMVPGYTRPREWLKYPEQQSAPITLNANTKYYIEAIHREKAEGDNLSVGWKLPDQTMERPIPGSRLMPMSGSNNGTGSCTATIAPKGSTTFCSGGNVVLESSVGSGFNYQWLKDGSNINGATAYTYNATSGGNYQVKIISGTCTSTSSQVRVTITNSLTAKITAGGPTTFCSGGQVSLYANTCSGYIYQWRKGSTYIPGATSATYVATTSGDYQIRITQGASVVWSARTNVIVNSCGSSAKMLGDSLNADITTEQKEHIVNLYPNPTTGMFSLDLCLEDEPEDVLEIRVLNAAGIEVYNKPPKRISGCVRETVELSGSLPTGIYIVQLKLAGKSESVKLLLGH